MKSEFTCKNLFIVNFFSAVNLQNVYHPPDQSDIRVITLHWAFRILYLWKWLYRHCIYFI